MKRNLMLTCFTLVVMATISCGQNVTGNGVPSVIINNFQRSFSSASDVEWDIDGALYKVAFETGWAGKDHDAWYDRTGRLVRHKEEISRSDLPAPVRARISKDYNRYRIDDVTKITEGDQVTYVVELKTFTEEWKVVFDTAGTVLDRVMD